jgi:hypothetical protein
LATEINEMTAEEARMFRRFSVHNAVQAQMACPESTCEAYRDIFTFRRWRAQGYRVRKGEKGTAVITWITTASPDRDREADGEAKPIRRPKRAVLFCRHQVERTA